MTIPRKNDHGRTRFACVAASLLLIAVLLVGGLPLACKSSQSGTDKRRDSAADETLTFVVLGDNRPVTTDEPQPAVFGKLLDMAKKEKPAFVISTGDIVKGSESEPDKVAEQYRQLRELVRKLGVPFYVARGNHDAVNPDLFDRFTKRPPYYSFAHGDAAFWILSPDSMDGRILLDDAQLEWLRNDLKNRRARNKFVVMHYPLVRPPEVDTLPETHRNFDDEQGDEVRRLLKEEDVDIVFSGHTHLFYHEKRGRIDYIVTGGAGAPLYAPEDRGGFYHYVVVKVRDGHVSAELVKLSGERETIRP